MDDDAQPISARDPERSSAVWPMMVLLALAAASLVAIQMRRPKPTNPFLGVAMPPLSAEGWLNTTTPPTPQSLRGNLVLIDFWATDCPSCVREMPELAALVERFREHGLHTIGLTPESGPDAERVKRLVADEKIAWPIGYGAGFDFEVMGVQLTPTYVLYDRAGRGLWGGHSLYGLDDVLVAELAKK
jgi:thiol-disulfide isomerase/thioredoxin